MGFTLDGAKAARLLLLQFPVEAIAEAVKCNPATIYRMRNNIWMFGSSLKPCLHVIGYPRKLTSASKTILLDWLNRNRTATQDEMVWFIWEECGIYVSQATVLRALKRLKWSRKKARRIAIALSLDLRRGYIASMAGIRAEQIVFLDESLFNETTGWHLTA